MTVAAIADDRWMRAQQAERAWWAAESRLEGCRQSAPWYAERLQITPEVVRHRTIIDLGAGPYPLALLLPLEPSVYVAVDPIPPPPDEPPRPVGFSRVHLSAENYFAVQADEVWGYNVLQHVVSPAEVIAVAMSHARERVRWFDWVETAVYPVHPHSIPRDWLRAQFEAKGWRVTHHEHGTADVPHAQEYVAIVAERPT